MNAAQIQGMRLMAGFTQAPESAWQLVVNGSVIMFDLTYERALEYARLYKNATIRRQEEK